MIDLYSLASTLKDEGLEMPLLFRFPDIVDHRLHLLQVRPPTDLFPALVALSPTSI